MCHKKKRKLTDCTIAKFVVEDANYTEYTDIKNENK